MAQHNSSAGVIDTASASMAAQLAGKKHGKLPIRAGTPRSASKSHSTLTSLSHPSSSTPSNSKISSSRRSKLQRPLRDLSRSHKKSNSLYRSIRKSNRARITFLLKRQQWKTSRQRSMKMEFVEYLREIQANESSDDEDFTFISTSSSSVTSSDGGAQSVVSEASTVMTSPPDSDNEIKTDETKTVTKASIDKQSAKPSTSAASVSVSTTISQLIEAEKSKINKKITEAKPLSPKPADKATPTSPTSPTSPTKVAPSEKKSGKRKLEDSPAATTAETTQREPATKKSKQENGKPGKPATDAAAKLAQQLKNQGPPPEMSSATPTATAAAPTKREHLASRDYQPGLAAMLDDRMGFEDWVHDRGDRPVTKWEKSLRNQFVGYRKYHKHPIPEPFMSGAIGPFPQERFDAVRKKDGLKKSSVAERRAGRASLRPGADYQGKQHQQYQQQQGRQKQKQYGRGGFKGNNKQHQQKQHQYTKYKKGSRFYSNGSKDADDTTNTSGTRLTPKHIK
ncbi:hypothetical protein QBC43DRAFT_324619 [Cladorrhinum sp. PSN259]|nr:hypothetical protein QBC43DRAFT_324619 [Cladorrhinum sp. PSN259]